MSNLVPRRFFLSSVPGLPFVAEDEASHLHISGERPDDHGRAIMRIGDRTVVVDTNAFDVRESEEAVVIGNDGRLKIDHASLDRGAGWRGKRSGYGAYRDYRKGEGPCGAIGGREGVVILGMVVAG